MLYGDTTDASWYFDLLKEQTLITAGRNMLIFGQANQGGGALDPIAAVTALSDDAEIAGFRTVTDEVCALENHRPPKGGPLSEGIVHGGKVTCPLHNWVIDLSDGESTGSDRGCARSFPIKMENDRIPIDSRPKPKA